MVYRTSRSSRYVLILSTGYGVTIRVPQPFFSVAQAFLDLTYAFFTVDHAFLDVTYAFFTIDHAFFCVAHPFFTVDHAFIQAVLVFPMAVLAFF